MSLVEAKELIRSLRSRGVKVSLFNGQPRFTAIEHLPVEKRMDLIRLGTFIREILKEEEIKRKARAELRETSQRLAERKRQRQLKDSPPEEL